METTMFLSSAGLQVVQGNVSKNNIQVEFFQDYSFPEGTMLDGVIMDEDSLKDVLKTLKTNGIDSTRLVIDSGQIIMKNVVTPKLNAKELKQFVQDELYDVKDQNKEFVYDYTVLQDSIENKEGMEVLCCGIERSILTTYINIFKEVKINIETIDILTNAVIKLAQSVPSLDNTTYVLSYISGNDITNYLFFKNKYSFTMRSRLFSDRGSVAFVTELSNAITKLIQFYKTTYKDEALPNLYFAGLDSYEEELIFSTIENNLEIKVNRFDVNTNIASKNPSKEFPINKYICVGSLFRK